MGFLTISKRVLGEYLKLNHNHFLPHSFQLIYSLTTTPFNTISSELMTALLVRVGVTFRLAVYCQQATWDSRPVIFFFQLNTCGYSPYVTSPLMRGWICCLQLLLVLASAVNLRSESHGTHDHILLAQIQESLNLEGQVPIFISPRNRVTRLYPHGLDSLFVASHDSQGYAGGIQCFLYGFMES
jgi:hypothetical protein